MKRKQKMSVLNNFICNKYHKTVKLNTASGSFETIILYVQKTATTIAIFDAIPRIIFHLRIKLNP